MRATDNEKMLVDAMHEGDENAFAAFYRHYGPQLYMNILTIVRDPEWAGEIVQELFTRVWQKRESPALAENFSGYLYRTAQNLIHDFFRRIQRDRHLADKFKRLASEHYAPIEESIDQAQLKRILQEAVGQLSPQQQKAFHLVRMEGKSYKQAAEIMGISPFTIKEYLTNSHKAIRRFILQHTGGEWETMLLVLLISCMGL